MEIIPVKASSFLLYQKTPVRKVCDLDVLSCPRTLENQLLSLNAVHNS